MEKVIMTFYTPEQLYNLVSTAMNDVLKTTHQTVPESESDFFLTRKETAEKLKISLPTLHDWSKRGLLKSYSIGGRILYKANEIESSLHAVKTVKY